MSHPTVELQDGPDRRDCTVRVADGEERAAWWDRSVAVWQDYASYPEKTEREVPVFVAEPA